MRENKARRRMHQRTDQGRCPKVLQEDLHRPSELRQPNTNTQPNAQPDNADPEGHQEADLLPIPLLRGMHLQPKLLLQT